MVKSKIERKKDMVCLRVVFFFAVFVISFVNSRREREIERARIRSVLVESILLIQVYFKLDFKN